MSALPLEGIRVLDLSRLLPGPFCSLFLADFGADVLRVEGPGAAVDDMRGMPPHHAGVERSRSSAMFVALNRNKRSVVLDLKTPAGRDRFLELAAEADVVLESFRPGVLDRLGLGYDVLCGVNPGVVLCSISGYGGSGPDRGRSGHDLNYLGLTGALDLTGSPAGPPVQPANQVADLGGGALMAAFGILCALRERDRSGIGQVVDVAMTDGAMSWMSLPAAAAFLHPTAVRRGSYVLAGSALCYRPYECADGWVTIGAIEAKFWQAFCDGVGRPDLVAVQYDRPESPAREDLEAIFSGRTRAEWRDFAARHDCCLEVVLFLGEAIEHEVFADMVVELDVPGAASPIRAIGQPITLSRTPADPCRLPPPSLGEHEGFTDRPSAGEVHASSLR